MSIALMTEAWKLDIPAGPKFVLLSLCDNANDQGECYPSISTIAERCSMGVRTVQGHVQQLVDWGFMRRLERAGRSTVYAIDPRRFCAPQIPHPAPAKTAPPPPQKLRPTPADPAPITVKEPSSEPKGKRQQRVPTPDRPDGVTEQTWADWLQLRKDKRAPVTQTVLDGAVEEAGKAGMSLEDFLKLWCRRGSQGLLAEWLKPQERSASGHPSRGRGRYAGAAAAIHDDEGSDLNQGDVIDA